MCGCMWGDTGIGECVLMCVCRCECMGVCASVWVRVYGFTYVGACVWVHV